MKILISYSPHFIPLAKLLHADSHELYTTHPDFAKQLNDIDIPAKALSSNSRDKSTAYRLSTHLIAAIYNEDIMSPMGLLRPEVYEAVKLDLPPYLYPRIPEISAFISSLESLHPDLIIVHNDVEPMMRACAQWALSNNVPCLHIPHAVYIDNFGRGAPGTDIHDIVTASHIAVAGPYQANWYRNRGGNIHVTGLPQHDKWPLIANKPDREQACHLLGVSPSQPVVTYASSWRQDTNLLGCHDGVEEAYINFLQAASQLQETQFIIKTHPRSSQQSLQWHIEKAKELGVTCSVTPLHNELVLQATDALVAYGPSNILIEASFFSQIRLISINGFEHDPEVVTCNEAPASIHESIITALREGPVPTQSFTYRYAGIPDGMATARIYSLIRDLLPKE